MPVASGVTQNSPTCASHKQKRERCLHPFASGFIVYKPQSWCQSKAKAKTQLCSLSSLNYELLSFASFGYVHSFHILHFSWTQNTSLAWYLKEWALESGSFCSVHSSPIYCLYDLGMLLSLAVSQFTPCIWGNSDSCLTGSQ